MRRLERSAAVLGVVLVLGLTGCGDDGGSDEPTGREGSTPSAEAEPTEPAGADLPHPCDRVTVEEMTELLGGEVAVTRTPESGTAPLMTCSFTGLDLEMPSVTLQTVVDGGTLRDFVELSTAIGDQAEEVEVAGADEAVVLLKDDTDSTPANVVAEEDGAIVGAISLGGPRDERIDLARDALALMLD